MLFVTALEVKLACSEARLKIKAERNDAERLCLPWIGGGDTPLQFYGTWLQHTLATSGKVSNLLKVRRAFYSSAPSAG